MHSPSTFMQFGTDEQVAAEDVGQPKFRLVEPGVPDEPLYLLLGSLHMPHETDETIDTVERHVNGSYMRAMLIGAMRRHCQRDIAADAYFEYVPRNVGLYLPKSEHTRFAVQ